MRMFFIFGFFLILFWYYMFFIGKTEDGPAQQPLGGIDFVSHQEKEDFSDEVARVEGKSNHSVNRPVELFFVKNNKKSQIVETGVDKEGRMETIQDAATVAWYGKGAVPGERGNAILAGHRDWKGELGFFQYLEKIELGEPIQIAYEDGSTKTYHVATKQAYNEEDVPPYVMSQEGENRITLITCTGTFDKVKRSYLKRLIITLK